MVLLCRRGMIYRVFGKFDVELFLELMILADSAIIIFKMHACINEIINIFKKKEAKLH